MKKLSLVEKGSKINDKIHAMFSQFVCLKPDSDRRRISKEIIVQNCTLRAILPFLAERPLNFAYASAFEWCWINLHTSSWTLPGRKRGRRYHRGPGWSSSRR